jgi:hypothetical protein
MLTWWRPVIILNFAEGAGYVAAWLAGNGVSAGERCGRCGDEFVAGYGGVICGGDTNVTPIPNTSSPATQYQCDSTHSAINGGIATTISFFRWLDGLPSRTCRGCRCNPSSACVPDKADS